MFLFYVFQVFQEETEGKGVCLAFVETLQRETIVSDARRAALTIQASTAKVILVFSWYTDVREVFYQLHKMNVSNATQGSKCVSNQPKKLCSLIVASPAGD